MGLSEIELVLEIEHDLTACLKKVRKYKLANNMRRVRKTQLSIVEEILANAARPLHVKEIICIAAAQYQVNLNRGTIVSAISKHVKTGKIFVKTGKNEFGLVGFPSNSL